MSGVWATKLRTMQPMPCSESFLLDGRSKQHEEEGRRLRVRGAYMDVKRGPYKGAKTPSPEYQNPKRDSVPFNL